MHNIEQLTRELGAALQLSPAYVNMVAARERNDADEELSGLMGELELTRLQYRHEAAKGDDADKAVMASCDARFGELYAAIMKNGNMQDYQQAASVLEQLLQRVTGILAGCAKGEDPASYEPDAGCGGKCGGGCKGCG